MVACHSMALPDAKINGLPARQIHHCPTLRARKRTFHDGFVVVDEEFSTSNHCDLLSLCCLSGRSSCSDRCWLQTRKIHPDECLAVAILVATATTAAERCKPVLSLVHVLCLVPRGSARVLYRTWWITGALHAQPRKSRCHQMRLKTRRESELLAFPPKTPADEACSCSRHGRNGDGQLALRCHVHALSIIHGGSIFGRRTMNCSQPL